MLLQSELTTTGYLIIRYLIVSEGGEREKVWEWNMFGRERKRNQLLPKGEIGKDNYLRFNVVGVKNDDDVLET